MLIQQIKLGEVNIDIQITAIHLVYQVSKCNNYMQ